MAPPLDTRAKLRKAVSDKAEMFDVDPKLVMAIITVESAWDPWAVRYEADYKYVAIPTKYASLNHTTVATECIGQSMSYGLSQIMGGTARHLGYLGPLPRLFDVELNILWCLRLLVNLQRQHERREDVIAAYNAGSPRKAKTGKYINQDYVDKVLSHLL